MPLYLFENTQTGETREVPFSMSDDKVYNGEDGRELGQWKRVFLVPQASIDSQIDPFDKNAFINNLATKKGETLGTTFDRSAEMSERRAALRDGVDPVKQKALDAYAAKRNGKRHPDELKQTVKKANEELKKLGINLKIPVTKSRRLT